MVWDVTPTLTDRLAQILGTLSALFPGGRRAGRTYQGFIKALIVQSPRLLAGWASHWRTLVRQVAGTHWREQGWVPIGVDGSRIALSHTQANQRAFGCGGKAHSGPSVWLVMLLHLGTNLPWAWKIAKATAEERGLLRQMRHLLPEHSLLIADAGYTGYAFWQTLQQEGQAFLIRVGASTRLLTQLGYAVLEYDGLVYVWPQRYRVRGQEPLALRLVGLHTGRTPVYLLTNVLSDTQLSDQQAAVFYRLRWGLEVFFRGLKQTLGKRQMRSQAPVPAALELRWAILGLAILGWWGVSRQPAGVEVRRVSLAQSLRQLRVVLRHPAQRCRPAQTLQRRLTRALRDRYVRRGPKVAGHWPHKKNEPPPQPPHITPATALQIHAAQMLKQARHAA